MPDGGKLAREPRKQRGGAQHGAGPGDLSFPVLGGDWRMCTHTQERRSPGRCKGEGGEVGTLQTLLSRGR